MTNDVGIRPDAERPIETAVKTTTAKRLARRCAHDRVAWVIGAEVWHVRKPQPNGSRLELLEPCGGKS